ncbi:MAG: glycerol transport system ATP-binding protein [Limisphaerales bacterium]|jgi:glycerol transport system ATP-binding protein
MAKIEFQKVSFSYPNATGSVRQEVVQDMSFVIDNGEARALLGASGAGKTTLLNLMSGLLIPTKGRILFDDVDVTNLNGFERKVAQVFQFPVVYEGLSVADNMCVPLKASGITGHEQSQRVEWLANELGLGDVLNQKPRSLSLFQKQLLAVGKALARSDVSLVLLDEPLTAVEPARKWSLRQTLRRAQDDTGVTMVYVTHDQTEALTFAQQVSLLSQDGIVQTGTPRQIYEEPVNEFVAHFVGSPGMNLLDSSDEAVDRIGFRPEWARIRPEGCEGDIEAKVLGTKSKGTRDGQVWGEITLQTSKQETFVVDGAVDLAVGSSVRVEVARWVGFKQGQQVSQHGL